MDFTSESSSSSDAGTEELQIHTCTRSCIYWIRRKCRRTIRWAREFGTAKISIQIYRRYRTTPSRFVSGLAMLKRGDEKFFRRPSRSRPDVSPKSRSTKTPSHGACVSVFFYSHVA
ncbi:uncharacterized protein LOC109853088 [Pseudomyrmex gracilis]|uniref:uncharacterized protein LOC109853088 n=1 Tax=Pseudomyrmex gracilis TaxID=219809 RepID=UPI00099521FC|nr:uncharacterized protein LOC109853088 [Pseudomyrmex gracilis]